MTHYINSHQHGIDNALGAMAAFVGGLVTGKWTEFMLAFAVGTIVGLISGFYLGVRRAKERKR